MLVRNEHRKHRRFQLRLYMSIFENYFQCVHNSRPKHYLFCLVNKHINIYIVICMWEREEWTMLIDNTSWQPVEKKLCLQKGMLSFLKREMKSLLIWNWYSQFDYYCSDAKYYILSFFWFKQTFWFSFIVIFFLPLHCRSSFCSCKQQQWNYHHRFS